MVTIHPVDRSSPPTKVRVYVPLSPVQVLEDSNIETSYNYKVRAIVTLGLSGDINAIELLLRCLASNDAGIRGWAAFGLGELLSEIKCTEGDVQALKYALLAEKDLCVKVAIEAAVQKIENSKDSEKLSTPNYFINNIRIKKPAPLILTYTGDDLYF